jgi:hypothetical protein
MDENYVPFPHAASLLEEIKKGYQKMKESCALFEREHDRFCQRIGLDGDAFNIEAHPDHPPQEIFQLANLSDRDRTMLGEYLGKREKMYLLEQCVRNIIDDDMRWLAEAYYLDRKSQPEIAAEIGRSKSYVSKKLDKAEKDMAATIERYFEWKYDVPGGKHCPWAGEWERQYMTQRDAEHGIIRFPDFSSMPWVKSLRRMGFL